jgi:hypothetical protein
MGVQIKLDLLRQDCNTMVLHTLPMKTDLKIPFEIDRLLLVQYDLVAKILGIPVRRYVESYLQALINDLSPDPVEHIANEIFYESYRSRELAEAAAERLEAYAIKGRASSVPKLLSIRRASGVSKSTTLPGSVGALLLPIVGRMKAKSGRENYEREMPAVLQRGD